LRRDWKSRPDAILQSPQVERKTTRKLCAAEAGGRPHRAHIHFQREGKLVDGASALAQIAKTREKTRKMGQKWAF